MSISKPSYYGQMSELRQEIMRQDQPSNNNPSTSANPNNTSGNSAVGASDTDNDMNNSGTTGNTNIPSGQSIPTLRGLP
jgi:hypothetical protein